MTTTTVSPFVVSEATEVELSTGGAKKKLWRKEILPSGTRSYKGQTLDFSKINPACVQAFDDGAFDAVPFVLALSDNAHPNSGQEAENLEGALDKLELSEDGSLYGYFDLSQSQKALGAIQKLNGKFGVSAKIEVGYKREDTGKDYSYALSHVCGTTRPHIKGMKPWEAVELSEEEKARETVDLSTEVVELTNDKKEGGELVTLQISQEELAGLRKFMADYASAEEAATKLTETSEQETDTDTTGASSVELTEARKRADMAIALAQRSQRELAVTRWEKREAELAREGVPPVLLTEAKKVLSLPSRSTITLSEEDGTERTIDASEVIEKMLEASKGVVKLGEEKGHQFGGNGSVDLSEDAEFKAFEQSIFSNL